MKCFKLIGALVGITTLITSCGNQPKTTVNTDSNEEVTFLIEDSYKPLFETSIYTFNGNDLDNNIVGEYLPEDEIIKRFFNNESKTIAITRTFTESEKSQLRKKLVEVREDMIAHDAIALITNIENKDTTITINKLVAILQGKDSLWSNGKKINLLFDKNFSANYNYLKQLANITEFPSNVYAANSNEEVIQKVKDNKNVIGVIGVNWISDEDDPKTLNFLDGINVLSVYNEQKQEYFKPFQAYIYNKNYPLTRSMYIINKASKRSVNTSFVNFMITDRGQLIILKSSLVPANKVARIISLTD